VTQLVKKTNKKTNQTNKPHINQTVMRKAIFVIAFIFAIVNLCLITQHRLPDERSADSIRLIKSKQAAITKPRNSDKRTQQQSINRQVLARCDFLEREDEEEEEEEEDDEEEENELYWIADETALDLVTAKRPFIFLQVNSGTFNQFHGLWPVFLLAQELHATVLVGCGVSRTSFLDDQPNFHPVPQSLFWDVGYMHRYWKKRGVGVYFSNFTPLLHQRGVVITQPLRARPYSLMPPFNLVQGEKEDRWVGEELLSTIIRTNDRQRERQQFLQLKQLQQQHLDQLNRWQRGEETGIRLITEMNIRAVIEREINQTITSDVILYIPSDFTFGAFATLTKETQQMAREAYLSIHMSPKVLEMGCEVWEAVQENAGRSLIIGVHLRLENDAYVWWEDSKLPDRLAAYSNTILSAANGQPRLFVYLAYGELPLETEKSIVEWADKLFGAFKWTTKSKILNRLKKNRRKKDQSEGTEPKGSTMKNMEKKKSYLDLNLQEYKKDILQVDQIEEDKLVFEQQPDVTALVDAYILTMCDFFVGPSISSFSFTIEQWRTHLNRTSIYLHNAKPEPPFYPAW